ncbi:MAG TPA: tannase/feruloyl esterase family alpha/beta hydrolase [Vicinamibacterales bacterium]|nr:tannase/feruloyl esterase family alpha/beta hydrolase [Vicinamibacterales bacterium]
MRTNTIAMPLLVAAALSIALSLSVRPIAATPCTNLIGTPLVNGTVTSAVNVTAPFTTTASSGPATITVSVPFAFCMVTARLTPTADSSITMELWMPEAAHWNRKFLGVGNGALTGAIWHTSMVRPVQSGYAVANSDLGHTVSTANWALGHPEKVLDYASRGDHVTAVASKALVDAFYGTGPRLSYFHGCSNGGHQALMEAQRFPDDYDAIIAGAPWNQWTHQNVEFISRQIALESLNPAKRAMITAAVVAQCGGRDGGLLPDGYLNEPQACRFKPASLLCAGADAPTCLTAPEVAAVEKIYEGPSDPITGLSWFPGFERGSEFGWVGFGAFSNNLFQNMVVENPSFDYHTFNFSSDVAFLDAKLTGIIDSINPDLGPFKSRGGKLLMWHGWTDTTLEPRSSLNYYNSVVAVTGGHLSLTPRRNQGDEDEDDQGDQDDNRRRNLDDTQDFFRLFLAPGVNHCGGGAGPNSSFAYTLANAVGSLDADHDILAALDRWVEHGIAPRQLIASHFTNGVADKTRPVCAYPRIARFSGRGDPNLPGSWACVNDWDRFNSDYAQELRNIRSDIRTGNLDNLPNGGFVKSRRDR